MASESTDAILPGILLALGAAVSNTAIDTLRKVASHNIPSIRAVCVIATLEAAFALCYGFYKGLLTSTAIGTLRHNHVFLISCFASGSLRMVSLFLYQTAIQTSPLSVTVPYLSLTPAMLLITAYLLIGEQPNFPGLIGVLVVAAGGYLLASTTSTSDKKKESPRGKDIAHGDSRALPAVKSHAELRKEQSGLSGMLLRWSDGNSCGMMCAVAFLWALNSSFDKLGIGVAPSLAVYVTWQRVCTAVPCFCYLLFQDVRGFRLLSDKFQLMVSLACLELTTVVCYMWSLKFLFVSYAVATKRSGILLSVFSGWLVFGEDIRSKIAYVVLMMCGMMLIVLSAELPGGNSSSHH